MKSRVSFAVVAMVLTLVEGMRDEEPGTVALKIVECVQVEMPDLVAAGHMVGMIEKLRVAEIGTAMGTAMSCEVVDHRPVQIRRLQRADDQGPCLAGLEIAVVAVPDTMVA